MNPGKIRGATRTLGAPIDWDPAKGVECVALDIRDMAEPDGSRYMQSTWYPTDEEKRLIAEGQPIRLTVWGVGHPPVGLDVLYPLEF